jgi:hypothetical protein
MMKLLAYAAGMVFGLSSLMGCATVRSDYAPATGEPMRVHDQTVTKHGTEAVVVGQDQYTDKNGQVIATKTRYANRDVAWEERQWYAEQGGAPMDDESFFHAVKDEEAIKRYDEKRADGVTKNRLGIVGTVVGVLAAGAGGTMLVMSKESDDKALRTGGLISLAAGAVIGGISFFAAIDGRRDAEDANLRLFDAARLKADARRYNIDKLGLTPVGDRPKVAAAAPPPPPSPPSSSSSSEIAETSAGPTTPVAEPAPIPVFVKSKRAMMSSTSASTLPPSPPPPPSCRGCLRPGKRRSPSKR